MSLPLNINGIDYFYPETGDINWGPDATDWAQAVTTGMLQKAGGLFLLLSDVDFGPNYGLKSLYYKSRSSNLSSTGVLRLSHSDFIGWRNNANSGDLALTVNSSDQLVFNGIVLNQYIASVTDTNSIDLTVTGTALSADLKLSAASASALNQIVALSIETDGLKAQISNANIFAALPNASGSQTGLLTSTDWTTFNNKQPAGNYITALTGDVAASGPGSAAATIQPGVIVNSMVNASAAIAYSKLALTGSIVNADVNASAAIAYSKLALTGSIVNADVNASAAIALTKLATTTASRALVSDASGFIVPATTTATEIGYVNGVTSSIQTQLNAKLNLSGGTMAGNIAMGANSITGMADPVNPQDAATKAYVDSLAEGLSVKSPVACATTGNITLSGEQTIDGVLTSASRVLVKNQSTPAQNGIYVSSSGAWSRSSDANTWAELVSAFVFVQAGTTQADTGWVCSVDPGGTLGTTPVTWVQFSSAGVILAGNGLTKTGNTLDVNIDNSTIDFTSNNLRVKPLGITNGEISGSAAIDYSKLNVPAGAIAYSKLTLTNSVVNADINSAAAIAYSKLALSNSIVNADINSAAAIAYSKLSLTGSIVNADINASAAIAYSKLASMTAGSVLLGNGSAVPTVTALSGDVTVNSSGVTAIGSGVIVNADVSASAAIALTKLAATTASRALVSNASGFIEAATTTATEIGYVNGVTSSIQTQLNAKVTNPMTTGGDIIYGGASGAPTRLANGSAGQILQSNGGTSAPTWVTPAGGYTVTAVSSNITLAASNIYLVSTAAARTLQLPSPSSTFICYIKDSTGQANTNNITLVRNASEQIEGVAASKVLQTNWGSWMLISDGTNWFLL